MIPARRTTTPSSRSSAACSTAAAGPLLRKATALDWAGDPIEVEDRFRLGHGEHSYAQMLEHFKDYNDIVGDHPMNLARDHAGAQRLHADPRTNATRAGSSSTSTPGAQRMLDNGGIIPTNIGLDGKIGGACGGKWYGGVYGWGFTVIDPGHASGRSIATITTWRSTDSATRILLTGDDRFLDVWRKQIDAVNSHAQVENGRTLYPHMYGDQGWYDYRPEPYQARRARALLLVDEGRRPPARARLAAGSRSWKAGTPAIPRRPSATISPTIRRKVEAMRRDPTTPDTRLADDPMAYNPATVATLVQPDAGRTAAQAPGRGAPGPRPVLRPGPPPPRPARRRGGAGRLAHGRLDLARPGQPQSDRTRET